MRWGGQPEIVVRACPAGSNRSSRHSRWNCLVNLSDHEDCCAADDALAPRRRATVLEPRLLGVGHLALLLALEAIAWHRTAPFPDLRTALPALLMVVAGEAQWGQGIGHPQPIGLVALSYRTTPSLPNSVPNPDASPFTLGYSECQFLLSPPVDGADGTQLVFSQDSSIELDPLRSCTIATHH